MRSRILSVIALLSLAAGADAQLRAPAIGDMWGMALDAARSGDFERAEATLEEIDNTQQLLGIQRLPSFATSAAGLAIQAESTGQRDLADWAMAAAERLDPGNPSVQAARADLLYMREGLGAAFGEFAGGFGAIMANSGTAVLARSDFLISVALAILLMAFALGLVLLVKYHRVLMHDGREAMGGRFGPGASTVLAFAFLFLPILLWLSPVWLIPWWLLLVFPYSSVRERIVVAIALVALAITPWLADRAAYQIAASQRAVTLGVEASITNSYDPDVARRIDELLMTLPDNAPLNLLAGNLALIEGDDLEAITRYQRAVEIDPGYAGAHLNIGNIHFLQEDQAAATFRYERAAELDPMLVAAYINNSIVAGESFDFPRQTQLIDQAKSIDRPRADALLAIESPLRQVHFYHLTDEEIASIAAASSQEGSAALELFGNYASYDPLSSFLHPLAIGSIVALIAALLIARRKTASACVKCGRTFCYRCKSSKDSATYCTQCIHIYIKRDGVQAGARQRKLEEVASYQKSVTSRTKLLSLIMPGSAQIVRNSAEAGIIAMFLFMLGISLAILSGHLAPIVSPAEAFQSILRILGIGIAALMWLIFTLPALFMRSRTA